MTTRHNPDRVEAVLASVIALGVGVAAIIDFNKGRSPVGLVSFGRFASLSLILVGCFVVAALALAGGALRGRLGRGVWRGALVASALMPAVLGDPTYGCLLLSVPLIDLRRRDPNPVREVWTVAVLASAALLIAFESGPGSLNEYEVYFVVGIALTAMTLFGDALRSLERGIHTALQLSNLQERHRLAEELHDSLGHHLLASSLQLRKARTIRDQDPDQAAVAADRAAEAVDAAIAETRLIVDAARGEADLATTPSIEDLVERITVGGATVNLDIATDHYALAPATRIAIYRIVQEALTNLVRHSTATSASVTTMTSCDAVTVKISDNGTGFDAGSLPPRGGLVNMRQRVEALGGQFAVDSTGRGTWIRATVPR